MFWSHYHKPTIFQAYYGYDSIDQLSVFIGEYLIVMTMCICTVCGGSIVTHSVQTVFLLCSGLLDTPQSLAQLLTPHRHLLSADLNTKVIRLCCSQQTLYNTNTKHVATTTLNIVFDILFLNSIMPSKNIWYQRHREKSLPVSYISREESMKASSTFAAVFYSSRTAGAEGTY